MGMTWEAFALSPADLDRVKSDSDFFREVTDYRNSSVPSYSLEKSWHGMHYLLNGDSWAGSPPLDFIIMGGGEVTGSDGGYGPARAFTPGETQAIQQALAAVTNEQFWSQFDPDEMHQQGVYPEIWDEPADELQEEYTMYLEGLQEFLSAAVSNGQGLLVWLM